MKKYSELTDREKKLIENYCRDNEDKFREFVLEKVNSSTTTIKSDEFAYEFAKHCLREEKLKDLLDE
jgi:hypothetical protein